MQDTRLTYKSQAPSCIPATNKWNVKLKTQDSLLPKYKYFGVNLTKYVKDLHEENYEIVMNKIKELNKWRDIPCL